MLQRINVTRLDNEKYYHRQKLGGKGARKVGQG